MFGLAILAAGSSIGMANAASQLRAAKLVGGPMPSMSPAWVIVVGAAEAILITLGTLHLLSMAREVRRRRRAVVAASPWVDHEVEAGLRVVDAATDRPAAFEALVNGVLGSTGATTAAVLLRTGRGALEVAASAGDSVDIDQLIVTAVTDAAVRVAPRRWVEDESADVRGYIVAPLVVDGSAIGVLVGTRPGDVPFGLRDLDVVCRLAAVDLPVAPSLVDDLTDLPTRRRLDRDLDDRDLTEGEVGLAVVAVDQFLRLRHEFGETEIDRVLCDLVGVVSAEVRDGDLVYRYDDEQFGVLLPAAGQAETAEIAERLRTAIEGHDFALGDGPAARRITVSVGTVVADSGDLGDLTARADRALSEAERSGRNRVVALGRG